MNLLQQQLGLGRLHFGHCVPNLVMQSLAFAVRDYRLRCPIPIVLHCDDFDIQNTQALLLLLVIGSQDLQVLGKLRHPCDCVVIGV